MHARLERELREIEAALDENPKATDEIKRMFRIVCLRGANAAFQMTLTENQTLVYKACLEVHLELLRLAEVQQNSTVQGHSIRGSDGADSLRPWMGGAGHE